MTKYGETKSSITDSSEHVPIPSSGGRGCKRSLMTGYDGTNFNDVFVSSSGAVSILGALVPKDYDYISLTYTGNNVTTVVYRTGGSGGTIVATLTLAYTGNNLTSVTRT